MDTITIHTTQNIDIDYEIGGIGERMVALIIDYAIFIPFLIIGGIVASNAGSTIGGIYFIILLACFALYDLLCETFFNGQSFGKRVMKIRVISLEGARPKFSQYLLRWLFRIIDLAGTGYLAGLICIIVTDKSQRLGDLVAGTVLVRTVPRTQMNKLAYVITDDTYEPVFPQAVQLTDNDISLIHEVINNYVRTGNNVAVYNLADKIREHLAINLPPNMNSMQFLQTLIKDYSHITSHADVV
jgi:uncharacterized RDD family membrane protein YckC